MSEEPQHPNVTEAVRAQASEEQQGAEPALAPPLPRGLPVNCDGLGTSYMLGVGVNRRGISPMPDRRAGDPLFRPLQIYALDPSELILPSATAVVNVPFERLKPGPKGRLLEVDPHDDSSDTDFPKLDLEEPAHLITRGIAPTPADPRFHQQMVYAVCSLTYATFRRALGRDLAWGFTPRPTPSEDGYERLVLRPYAFENENAEYSKATGSIDFGYFKDVHGSDGVPGGNVFTSLSHDIVTHEMTHALLDGLRAHFTVASSVDGPAFHEAFADLVAIFQHFSYEEVVKAGLREARGKVHQATLLTDLARQFGHATRPDTHKALRTAVRTDTPIYDPTLEIHELGSVLVSAVFAAFMDIFERKTQRLVLLASNGTGILPPGEIPVFLLDLLAEQASKLAGNFLSILIRAIDYCPPIDIRFGEYLRAIITADRDLVPADPWRYRASFMRAFAKHRIFPPPDVRAMAEDELVWRPPERDLLPIDELTFANLQFRGDPAHPVDAQEVRRQACALGRTISDPRVADLFGFAPPSADVDPPCIESIRTTRRVGPDGEVLFDLVAEVTQRRVVRREGEAPFEFFGGATLIIDPAGRVRYVIRKSVKAEARLKEHAEFIRGRGGQYWTEERGVQRPTSGFFKLVHRRT